MDQRIEQSQNVFHSKPSAAFSIQFHSLVCYWVSMRAA